MNQQDEQRPARVVVLPQDGHVQAQTSTNQNPPQNVDRNQNPNQNRNANQNQNQNPDQNQNQAEGNVEEGAEQRTVSEEVLCGFLC